MNVMTVKAFSQEQREIQRFEKKSQNAKKLGQDKSFFVGISSGVEHLMKNAAMLCVAWYGAILVNQDKSLTSGELSTYLMYTTNLADAAGVISAGI